VANVPYGDRPRPSWRVAQHLYCHCESRFFGRQYGLSGWSNLKLIIRIKSEIAMQW